MFKKFLLLLTFIGVLALGTQIYAASMLNSNIVTLISDGIDGIKTYYVTLTTQGVSTINGLQKEDMGEFIEQEKTRVNSELQQHVDSEIGRVNSELGTYAGSLKEEVSGNINIKLNSAKSNITEVIDEGIVSAKEDILKEVEKQIRDKLK